MNRRSFLTSILGLLGIPLLGKAKTPQIEDQIKDYVLLMLGAPAVTIELSKFQLDMIVNNTLDTLKRNNIPQPVFNKLAQFGSLSQAKIVLGHIRYRYNHGENLITEGSNEYYQWISMLESRSIPKSWLIKPISKNF